MKPEGSPPQGWWRTGVQRLPAAWEAKGERRGRKERDIQKETKIIGERERLKTWKGKRGEEGERGKIQSKKRNRWKVALRQTERERRRERETETPVRFRPQFSHFTSFPKTM